MSLMKKRDYIFIWFTISLLVGGLGSYIFKINFWIISIIVGLILIINGLIADWEDRDI